MKTKLLLQLADLLETVEPKRFDYSRWFRNDAKCGTVACALGWACTLPETGLYAEARGSVGIIHMAGSDLKGIYAAARAFDVSERTATLLFVPDTQSHFEEDEDDLMRSPGESCTPAEAAGWIRRVVMLERGAL